MGQTEDTPIKSTNLEKYEFYKKGNDQKFGPITLFKVKNTNELVMAQSKNVASEEEANQLL